MVKNILFDLDGTLLPMDTDKFLKLYFNSISKIFCEKLELSAEQLRNGIWFGFDAMQKNDGAVTNQERFWKAFSDYCKKNMQKYEVDFNSFYNNEFIDAKQATNPNPLIAETLNLLREKGYKLILATNPAFPLIATVTRVRWAGLDPKIFDYISVYDNSHFCKPNTRYFLEITNKLGIKCEECLMVGNDVTEDMCSKKVGMETFLVKDCILNNDNLDYSEYTQGMFIDFMDYVEQLPKL